MNCSSIAKIRDMTVRYATNSLTVWNPMRDHLKKKHSYKN